MTRHIKMVTHLLMDDARDNRVAGAVGFNVRTGNYHVFKSKTVIVGDRHFAYKS
jgi:adenylylsulfate reductase subunit A